VEAPDFCDSVTFDYRWRKLARAEGSPGWSLAEICIPIVASGSYPNIVVGVVVSARTRRCSRLGCMPSTVVAARSPLRFPDEGTPPWAVVDARRAEGIIQGTCRRRSKSR
jgi:hypothetical protein